MKALIINMFVLAQIAFVMVLLIQALSWFVRENIKLSKCEVLGARCELVAVPVKERVQ